MSAESERDDGLWTESSSMRNKEQEATSLIAHSLNRERLGKRPYKPVESVLMSYSLVDDSEDEDDDYVPAFATGGKKQNGKADKEEKTGSDSGEDDEDDDEDDDDSGSDSASSDEEDEEESDDDENEEKAKNKEGEEPIVVPGTQTTRSRQQMVREINVCSVCLLKVSRDAEDVVECDACGLMVHEFCYGITADDAESVHSNASSASSEPWFCEPCTAGCKSPQCDLCPNLGGIFKLTDQGRWIHMVCALYAKPVTFRDLERLELPSVRDIPPSELGKRTCSLCEDERLANTGWCLKCDTGMCNTYFHVTCAQRAGLLKRDGDDLTDPLYYHADCSLHNKDREAIRRQKQSYLVLLAKMKLIAERFGDGSIEDSITNERNRAKLHKQALKFEKNYQSVCNGELSASRNPRALESSPSVVRRLCTKSEATGMIKYINQTLEDMVDIRKKWYIPPAFSVEFVGYYLDRNERIEKFAKQSAELEKANQLLKAEEARISAEYETKKRVVDEVKKRNDDLRSSIRQFLSKCSNPKLVSRISSLRAMNPQQASPTSKKQSKRTDPASLEIKKCDTCKGTNDQYSFAFCDTCKLHYHLACLDPPLKRMPKKNKFGGWQCSNCTEREEEEYEASGNVTEADDDMSPTNEDSMDTNATDGAGRKRKLRRNPKPTNKQDEISPFSITQLHPKEKRRYRKKAKTETASETLTTESDTPRSTPSGKKRGRKPRSKASQDEAADSETKKVKSDNAEIEDEKRPEENVVKEQTEVSVSDTSSVEKPKPKRRSTDNLTSSESNATEEKVFSPPRKSHECAVCHKPAQNHHSVRCDNCECFYHFDCFDPPIVKSPKRRGYTWVCKSCEEQSQNHHTVTNGQDGFSPPSRRSSSNSDLATLHSPRRASKEAKEQVKKLLKSENQDLDLKKEERKVTSIENEKQESESVKEETPVSTTQQEEKQIPPTPGDPKQEVPSEVIQESVSQSAEPQPMEA